jgi:hypothetical protein
LLEADGAARLRALREAALADDSGAQLGRVIAAQRIQPSAAA